MLKKFLKIKYVNSHWEVSSKLFQKMARQQQELQR